MAWRAARAQIQALQMNLGQALPIKTGMAQSAAMTQVNPEEEATPILCPIEIAPTSWAMRLLSIPSWRVRKMTTVKGIHRKDRHAALPLHL